MKRISIDERKGSAEKQVEPCTVSDDMPERTLTEETLDKLIRLHYQDPLVNNISTLSRVFKINESYCSEVVNFVKPLVYYQDNTVDDPRKLIKGAIVIDVERLQSDEGYLKTYKKIVFPAVGRDRIEQ